MLTLMGGRLASPVFIGRREALAAASKAIDRTLDGRPSHLLVAGEAGIGKSRFGLAVAELARARGFLVVRGGCVRLGSGELPYAPIAEAMGEMARGLSPDALAAVVGDDGTILARVTGALGSPGRTRSTRGRPKPDAEPCSPRSSVCSGVSPSRRPCCSSWRTCSGRTRRRSTRSRTSSERCRASGLACSSPSDRTSCTGVILSGRGSARWSGSTSSAVSISGRSTRPRPESSSRPSWARRSGSGAGRPDPGPGRRQPPVHRGAARAGRDEG